MASGPLAVDRSLAVTHFRTTSSHGVPDEARLLETVRAETIYFSIHKSTIATALVGAAALVGSVGRERISAAGRGNHNWGMPGAGHAYLRLASVIIAVVRSETRKPQGLSRQSPCSSSAESELRRSEFRADAGATPTSQT